METEKSPGPSLAEKVAALAESGAGKHEIAAYLGVPVSDVAPAMPPSEEVEVCIVMDGSTFTPFYGSDEAAGIDLCTKTRGGIEPGERLLVRTGLSMALPRGTFGMIAPRSGLALKHGITVLNAPGIIDSDYRGDVGVILHNTDTKHAFNWKAGDRIAQLVVMSHIRIKMREVIRLDDTQRGANGFGSTGVSG